MRTRGLVYLALLAASAASAQTFDFTGVITSANQLYAPGPNPAVVGTPVVGSFTLDFANAQSSTGTIGSSSWSVSEASPTETSYLPTSSPPTVFALNLTAGGFSYSTVPPTQAALNSSSISGEHGVLTASEQGYPNSAPLGHELYSSSITLDGYGPSGLPGSSERGSGQLYLGEMGIFVDEDGFSIRSVTRVAPEIDPELALSAGLLLLGGLAVLRGGRRRTA